MEYFIGKPIYGGNRGERIEEFFVKYEHYSDNHQWDEKERLIRLPTFLTGIASLSFIKLKYTTEILTWTQVKKKLIKEFSIREETYCNRVNPGPQSGFKLFHKCCDKCTEARRRCYCPTKEIATQTEPSL
jgi:hypothetical protein